MQKRHLKYAVVISAAAGLAYCGGDSPSTTPGPTAMALPAVATLTVPGISSSVTYSFDLGAVDQGTGLYYVTDRTNKSIDVVDLNKRLIVAQFKPSGANAFAGCNSTTGTTTAFP